MPRNQAINVAIIKMSPHPTRDAMKPVLDEGIEQINDLENEDKVNHKMREECINHRDEDGLDNTCMRRTGRIRKPIIRYGDYAHSIMDTGKESHDKILKLGLKKYRKRQTG